MHPKSPHACTEPARHDASRGTQLPGTVRPLLIALATAGLIGCQGWQTAADTTALKPTLVHPVAVPEIPLRPAFEPAAPADLWERMRQRFMFPELDDPRIDAEVGRYTQTPVFMQRVATRAERYLYHIISETERRGLPAELALVPIVESALDPFAYSHGQAAGLWQFIPSTGRKFGLQQDWWHDQRRDVVASTDAALNYLESLYKQFGDDWLLALAAYNAGQGNVRRAQRINRNAGRPTDYFSLTRLPAETRAYVPKVLALRAIIQAPEQHAIMLPTLENTSYFRSVSTEGQVDLDLAARLAGVETREIYLLNPALSRWASHPQGPHRLLVPKANAEALEQALSDLPAERRVAWQRHQVSSGESLSVIAQRYDTDLQTLRRANQLNGSLIRAGQDLMIPVARADASSYSLSSRERDARRVARQQQDEGRQSVEHQVRNGESFWKIARQYGVGMRQLASWNGMATNDPLRTGQTLTIWLAQDDHHSDNGAHAQPNREAVVRSVSYRVRSGDSLARIASRFQVRISDLVEWNGLDRGAYLQPGQRLRLYVSVLGSP